MGKTETKTKQTSVQTKKQPKVQEEKDEISLFTHPFKTLYYFLLVVKDFTKNCLSFLLKNIVLVVLLSAAIIVPNFIEGPHSEIFKHGEQIAYFCLYWIILGVASSIGLGTGLHTFVLYLGPRIAKITMRAYQCNALPQMLPNKWDVNFNFSPCPTQVTKDVEFLDILLSVQLEAFLWGFGTAIGELPPYFIAKAAAASKKKIEELEDVEAHKNDKDFMSIAKRVIYNNLQKWGFITVLLCASIPNPLFDLAGITCGHFGIPFITFFSATAIGKSIIKVHIQMLFVIFIFSKGHVEHVIQFIESAIPYFQGKLSEMLIKQQNALTDGVATEGAKPLVGQLWDYFIILMISYFVLSIVNSLAQGRYSDEKEEQNEKKNKKQK